MAQVSYLRTSRGRAPGALSAGAGAPVARRRRRGPWLAGGLAVLVLAGLAAGAVLVSASRASLSADGRALARVGMPFGGGTVSSVTVVTGPHSQAIPADLRDGLIWPNRLVKAGAPVTIDLVVRRPGWISWLTGATQTVHLTLTTPVASLRSHYLTLRANQPLQLRFKAPISVIATAPATGGHLARRVLASPTALVTYPRTGPAGTILVAAAPRIWETGKPAAVSWFPGGSAATAVASPTPGTAIKPGTPISLTFSKPVAKALGDHRPLISPATKGSWSAAGSHTIVFRPVGYGYGLGATVHLALPSGVRLVGGQGGASSSAGSWSVPGGSTLRVQQILSLLGYLPLNFHYRGAGVGLTAADQLAAAVKPPAGHFSWRWSNTPAALRSFWSPGSYGTVTRGALMAFESDRGLVADGVAGPQTWKSLIAAVLAGHRSSSGYTFVTVSVSAQRLTVWHNGQDVVGSTPVNTGIPSAPTATGTYPVYEHLPVTTMSGTNPDGSHYSDPGIPWVSYFNGGDALHGFTRASYGSPQSLGCVEMPFAEAAKVYPYTPIGTLVHVA